jgi:hypothetical protein
LHGGAAVMRDGVICVFPADVGIVRDRASVARHYNDQCMRRRAGTRGRVRRSSCVCVTIFVTMSGAEQNLDDGVVHYYGSEALTMSCRAILVVRVCVGVRLTHEKPPAEPAPHAADALDTDIS